MYTKTKGKVIGIHFIQFYYEEFFLNAKKHWFEKILGLLGEKAPIPLSVHCLKENISFLRDHPLELYIILILIVSMLLKHTSTLSSKLIDYIFLCMKNMCWAPDNQACI